MKLRELDLTELRRLHETELREAFPPEELKPYAAMETLVKAGVYHPVGAWEGETLVGYAVLWESPGSRYVLIDYTPKLLALPLCWLAIYRGCDMWAVPAVMVGVETPEGVAVGTAVGTALTMTEHLTDVPSATLVPLT